VRSIGNTAERTEKGQQMTRKDYELIAKAFRIANGTIKIAPYDAETALDLAMMILADSLEKENPRFDRKRFIGASVGISTKDL
jgi:hypothetical protein